ncbi:MAG: hypothetical protein WCT53_02940 [Candidatus Gracilibacteria bacterium]
MKSLSSRVFAGFFNKKGMILIEILIGIVVLAVAAILITQMSVTTFRSTKATGQQSVMNGLAQEALEAAEALVTADWRNIYDKTKGSQEYYPKINTGAWTLTTDIADKTITLDGVAYSRWVIIDNVQRDGSDNIVPSGTDDPSTQKVTVNVTASGLPNLVYTRYFGRDRNTTLSQTDWSGSAGQETNPASGFDANYNSSYSSTDGNLVLGTDITLQQ